MRKAETKKVEEKPKPKPVAAKIDSDPKPDVITKKKKKGPMLSFKKKAEEKKKPPVEENKEKKDEKKTTKKKKSGPVKMSDVISDITKRLDDLDMNTLKKILDICKSKEGDADW